MAQEMLGMMVTKYENVEHIAGIAKAARGAGKGVVIFLTDEAVRFTTDPKFKNSGGRAGSAERGAPSGGLTLADDTIEVYILDRKLDKDNPEVATPLELVTDLDLKVYSNNPENGYTTLSLEEMAKKLLEYDVVVPPSWHTGHSLLNHLQSASVFFPAFAVSNATAFRSFRNSSL